MLSVLKQLVAPVSVLLVMLTFSLDGLAQTRVLDSLNTALVQETNPLRQVDLHFGIARAGIFHGDFRQGKAHLDRALKLSQEEGYDFGKVRALLLIVTTLEEDYDDRYKAVLKEAEQIAERSGDPRLKRMVDFSKLSDIMSIGDLEASRSLLEDLSSTYPPKTVGQRASALSYQAELHLLAGEDSLAIVDYRAALPLYDQFSQNPPVYPELGRPSTMHTVLPYMNQAKIHVEIGRLLSNLGNLEEALASLTIAEKLFTDAEADSFLGWTLMDIGGCYAKQGEMEKAVDISQQAIKIFERQELAADLADAYYEISNHYMVQGDLDVAESFLDKSYAIVSSRSFFDLEFDVYQQYANVYSFRQNPLKARSYLEKAIAVAEESGDDNLIAPGLYSLGKSQFLAGETAQAIETLKRSKEISVQLNSWEDIFEVNQSIAKAYLSIGAVDSADNYYALNVQSDEDVLSVSQKQRLSLLGSMIAEQREDYQLALSNWKDYHNYHRQLFSGAAQGKLKEEQVRQNVREINRTKELAQQEAELLSRRNQLYLLLALGLLGVLVFAGYAYQQIRKVKLELESKNLQLEQLNTTKDKFFGIIAHDIRSPIVALDGVGEQMNYYLEKGRADKLKRLARRVNGTAKRLSSLLDNLLNWALLQQGVIPYHPKAIDVAQVGHRILDMYSVNAEVKNITLSMKVEAGTDVYADEAALQTILRNLVSNAIKFTPEGGEVSIGTETKDGKVFITVNDTGTGISAEKLKRLFTLDKVSEQGTAGEKGTGLGLVLVKELAELNKGSLVVRSEPSSGTMILVELPMAA